MIPAEVSPPVPAPHPAAAVARCETHACWRRVSRRRHVKWRWRWYKDHPMPTCTWGPESSSDPATGKSFVGKPWVIGRYRVRNPSSTAGGKFQILDTTWVGNGGTPYRDTHPAAVASKMEQEKIGRVVLRRGGLSQWVNC